MNTKFQRRHYEAIAEVFSEEADRVREMDYDGDPTARIEWERLRNRVIWMFESDNPNFDRQRFVDACVPQ